ncbi:MAG TPA: hypothetical protein VFA48_02525 [Gammaproteobacteria bacterium]|nr:hypothetical protein [Gammaproteobacteria bacterium]
MRDQTPTFKRAPFDLNRLPRAAKKLLRWREIKATGCVDLGRGSIYVIDTDERALIIHTRRGKVERWRFARQTFERLMRRYARVLAHRSLLDGGVR